MRLFFAAALLALSPILAQALDEGEKPFLHSLFSENTVLQRDMPVPVWGWTKPGETVTVSMEGKTASATAGADGKWLAKIGPFSAGGPFTLTVAGPQTVKVENVLIGDVWICSGQSNMEQGIGIAANPQEEIAKADYPMIHLYTVPKLISLEPRTQVNSKWLVCNPANIANGGWGGFSAVGYFFGRQLHLDLKVPIGLIHTSWGGTVAEAWTSGEALKTMPDFKPSVEMIEQTVGGNKGVSADQLLIDWYKKNDPGTEAKWEAPEFNAAAWKTMQLPVLWEQAGLPNFDGIVWFRKEVEIPAGSAGKDLALHLGPIDDRDTTFFNGVKIGAKDQYNENRDYKIPGNLVKAGKAVIAVRVLDTGGGGGIWGKPEQMTLDGGENPISLAGPWQYQDSTPFAKCSQIPVTNAGDPNVTTVLYNGMIAPLLPYGIKGAIWYQGESNAGRAMQYRTLLPTMIKDWRARFGVGDFPFFIVSLASFMQVDKEPAESQWAELREAQLLTAQTLPNAGIAMAIDIGDANDIHPKNKQDVGKRLALAAEAIALGKKIEYSGPVYKSMEKKDNAIRVSFDHVGAGLDAKGGELKGFAIAGDDKKFVWADAKIEGDVVVLSSPKVAAPTTVRYGWGNNPICTLYNKDGLPAVPFRSDMPK